MRTATDTMRSLATAAAFMIVIALPSLLLAEDLFQRAPGPEPRRRRLIRAYHDLLKLYQP